MVLIDEYHPEDIKAAIRKRYRSVVRFEVAEKLSKGSVAEVLRGRKTRRTEDAVRRVMREEERARRSINVGHSSRSHGAHRLNAEAR